MAPPTWQACSPCRRRPDRWTGQSVGSSPLWWGTSRVPSQSSALFLSPSPAWTRSAASARSLQVCPEPAPPPPQTPSGLRWEARQTGTGPAPSRQGTWAETGTRGLWSSARGHPACQSPHSWTGQARPPSATLPRSEGRGGSELIWSPRDETAESSRLYCHSQLERLEFLWLVIAK